MKRKIGIFATIMAALLLASCTPVERLKNIKVTSASVQSLSPTGLRSLHGVFLLGIDNPSVQFTGEDISGIIKYKGAEYAEFTVSPITVKGRTAAVYELQADAALKPGVSLLEVLALARNYDLADFTADVDATIKLKSGVGKAISLKDINIKELLE